MRAVVPLSLTIMGCLSVASAQASQVTRQPQSAVDRSEVYSAWQSLTKVDVEAAYRLLRDNHPAASSDAHDPAFIAALDRAQKQGLARAQTVRSLDGYAATLREFANTMGDGHVSSYTRFDRDTVTWAGMIAAKRGVDWIVARADKDVVGAEIIGAKITACDGEPIARLAQRVMHFRTVAGSEAMQIMRAGRLLLDDGNPFLSRPKVCEFNHDGVSKSVTLNWQEVGRDQLQKTYWKPVPGAAGFGLRAVGQGYWLSIEALEPKSAISDRSGNEEREIPT